jgi:hypothetical protein
MPADRKASLSASRARLVLTALHVAVARSVLKAGREIETGILGNIPVWRVAIRRIGILVGGGLPL